MSFYDNIPDGLKWDAQWCLAGPDSQGKFKAPHTCNGKAIFPTKITQPQGWKTFDDILEDVAQHPNCGIGYVITKNDPYTCIDLDIKDASTEPNPAKWTTPEQVARYHKIIEAFDSYTEYSSSGLGFHIWIRGKIGLGLKRDGVEIYSQDRFMVCTGKVYLYKEIEDRQELLSILASEISAVSDKPVSLELVEVEATESDDVLFQRAALAENGAKFQELCEGVWSTNDYPSQSEADLALMSIFTFYSKSNSQCRRMFRLTGLGQRAKATKNDVALNRILRIIRTRQQNEDDADAHGLALSLALLVNYRNREQAAIVPLQALQSLPPALVPVQQVFNGVPAPVSAYAATLPTASAVTPESIAANPIIFPDAASKIEGSYTDRIYEEGAAELAASKLSWPPGLIGELARYIYSTSPRPVAQVAIVAALGLMAGICGRPYNISQTGLNLYIVLIAKSAVGKEAMHSGISNIVKAASSVTPAAFSFIDFTDYVSGPALSKAVAANPCFLNINGEWGRKLARLAVDSTGDGAMQSLRTVMTNLYQKSGANSIVGGLGYSSKENNVVSVSGAAYSMIGETTPDAFLQCLTEGMMSDGFMSRFTIVEYNGDRVPLNRAPLVPLDSRVLECLTSIMVQASSLNAKNEVCEVAVTEQAQLILDNFNVECDGHINGNEDDESVRQMWNRAHLKALKISALLACADNHISPLIMDRQVLWALEIIINDIVIMRSRLKEGKVGVSDNSRERKLVALLNKFVRDTYIHPSYNVTDKMHEEGVVSKSYFQLQTNKAAAFTAGNKGHTIMLDGAIKSLIDQGIIAEVPKEKLLKEYGVSGRAFRIIRLPEEM
jgi:hypothetical protein